jgi:nucleoside-diphosphate-sugar epimerase
MFDSALNLLLEQAVHPLAQIHDLFGEIHEIAAVHAAPVCWIDGAQVVQHWAISAVCAGRVGQLQLGFGQSHPVWQIVVTGDDGGITADYVRSRLVVDRRGRYLDPLDRWRHAASSTTQVVRSDLRATSRYLLSQLSDRRGGDDFLASVVGSARDFYARLHDPATDSDEIGPQMVALCETLAAAVPAHRRARRVPWRGHHEVLVVGGTGFIGRHVVRALIGRGRGVAVLARDVEAVAAIFADDPVGGFAGNVLIPDSLDAALAGCRTVINLAQGGSEDPSALRTATVAGARNVAERAALRGVEQLLHVSSIAALYLGGADDTITGASATDPERNRRADYAQAKAEAEEVVRALCREHRLGLTILRPGIVIGEGRTPFHGGVGEFNCETHCLGWNRGRNPLPFVLVEDVAAAIASVVELGPAAGPCFNLVGDVRLSAREYIEELGRTLGRPLCYHGRHAARLYGTEWLKWLAKRAAGRYASRPSYRDLRSRGMIARFDTADVKAALSWQPEATRTGFVQRGLACHAR